MKVLAFAASNSRRSINQVLVKHAGVVLKDEFASNAEIEVLDLNDFEMPIYSADREAEGGIPELAQSFYAKIGAADVILVSYAEHNGNYSAAYKNVFDWASRINGKVFQGKPMVVMSTSPGPGGAASVLRLAVESAPFFGADIRGSLSVPSFHSAFENGVLVNTEAAGALRDALAALV